MSKKPNKSARNPIAGALRSPENFYAKRVEKSEKEKNEVKDPWSKKAKHKKRGLDDYSDKPQSLAEFYQIGDHVELIGGPVLARVMADRKKKKSEETKDEKPEAIVRVHGPERTLGVTIDGEYHIIDEKDVELIYEAFAASEEEFTKLIEWSYAPTTAGFNVPISSEEQMILDKCAGKMYKSNLDEREQEVARLMVSRGVLTRGKDAAGLYFKSNNAKLTRF